MTLKLLEVICLGAMVFFVGCQEQKKTFDSEAPSNKTAVKAYYFHRTIRCKTCLAIETNAERTIRENFAKELADGRLAWLPLNIEEPNSQKLAKEFDIIGSALVIAKMNGDSLAEYKELEKVWELLGNPQEFSLYVAEEINEYLYQNK